MDDKLKLLKTPAPLTQSNNFWRVCPRHLEYLPEKCCEKGKPKINPSNGKIHDEPECPWWINSAEHHYCFWRYIQDKSGPDGVMQELVQSELAQLFGWSNTKTHFMLKQAMEELTNALNIHGAFELLEEIDDNEFQSMVDVPSDDYDSE